jgi:hypothetical protein
MRRIDTFNYMLPGPENAMFNKLVAIKLSDYRLLLAVAQAVDKRRYKDLMPVPDDILDAIDRLNASPKERKP